MSLTTQKSPEPLVLADGGSDHSSDLAATEFWSCKKKVRIFYSIVESSHCILPLNNNT